MPLRAVVGGRGAGGGHVRQCSCTAPAQSSDSRGQEKGRAHAPVRARSSWSEQCIWGRELERGMHKRPSGAPLGAALGCEHYCSGNTHAELSGSDGSPHMLQQSGRMDRSQRRPPHAHASVPGRRARTEGLSVMHGPRLPVRRREGCYASQLAARAMHPPPSPWHGLCGAWSRAEGGLLSHTARGMPPPPHGLTLAWAVWCRPLMPTPRRISERLPH